MLSPTARNLLVMRRDDDERTERLLICLSPTTLKLATSGYAWTNLSLRPQSRRHPSWVRDEAVTCRTDSNADSNVARQG
jgi:hypothetical protein